MLTSLQIKNFAIISTLELEFSHGLNIITGETGAGKTILLDAINFCLGERFNLEQIVSSQYNTEVILSFKLNYNPLATTWLINNQLLESALEPEPCIIRRVATKDGKTRAYINGSLVTINQLKQLSALLVALHGQYQQQSLLMPNKQLEIIDSYAENQEILNTIAKTVTAYNKALQEYHELLDKINQDRVSFISYQLQEISELNLTPNTVAELEQELKALCSAHEVKQIANTILATLNQNENSNIIKSLYKIKLELERLLQVYPQLKNNYNLMDSALIQLIEAHDELEDFVSSVSTNQQRLQLVENKLNKIYTIARKHYVSPEDLFEHQNKLQNELNSLTQIEEHITALKRTMHKLQQEYYEFAEKLSHRRKAVALQLEQAITTHIHALNMQHAKFVISIDYQPNTTPHNNGSDTINFLISTNIGQALKPLRETLSGGELSRVSLAIETLLAKNLAITTLIFDEIDVGVSGKTATIVGKLMHELAKSTQIISITHLAQVAVFATSHYKVIKETEAEQTRVLAHKLDYAEQVEEVARLIGNNQITETAISHAKHMLEAAIA